MTLEDLHRRARQARSRYLVRQREYRERDLAGGVWAKLQAELALTERAYRIDEATARALESAGRPPLEAGLHLSPELAAYVLSPAEVSGVELGNELRVGLPELLHAGRVVLVRFAVADLR